MAEAASSSPPPYFKYDVFISFRGLDTRVGFLSHLIKALRQKGINAYVDDRLEKGDEILSALLTAIVESQIALIIFSPGYASSKWCLKELVKITECQKERGQIVIPIFYKVDPSQVRHQKSSYAKAFNKYENNSEDDVDKWRTALNEVANLSGFHHAKKSGSSEALLIEEVVKCISKTLNDLQRDDVLQGLVGIHKPLEDLKSLVLANGSNDVRLIGIYGMGGIGKTTIASALFLSLRSEYESGYFLANVREQIEKHEMLELRNKLHCILLEDKDLDAGFPNVALAHVLRRLRRKKILVVLDDVINLDQVSELVGGRGQHGWLGPGSRIIVTTRDKHVLLRKEADYIYQVKPLRFEEALQLLTLNAFNGNDIPEGYVGLMVEVANYAKGNPLALKVLGSFLYGKSVEEWKSQLDKLQNMPFRDIQNVLRLSYDKLDRKEKKILLLIACFFRRVSLFDTILLEACGYSIIIALRTLEDRCLIERNNFFGKGYVVHNLIQQMCQEIVREQNIEKPGERQHLWDPNDIYHVLKYDKGSESIESIRLDISKINDDLNLTPYSFASMLNLKFLKIYINRIFVPWDNCEPSPRSKYNDPDTDPVVHAREDHLIFLPNNLRTLHWDYCPFKSLSPNLDNLVELLMPDNSLQKLWDGTQNLPNLRKVSLLRSKQLREIPDLSKALNLEELYLNSCENLESVHPSVFSLPKLVKLYMCNCKRLKRLPDLSKALSLEELYLNFCENLISVHPSVFSHPKLVKLYMHHCEKLERLPEEVSSGSASPSASSSPSNLKYLDLTGCVSLKHLPDTFYKLTSLQQLHLRGCKELDTSNLHILFGGLSSLTWLQMSGCYKLYEVPDNVTNLSLLKRLSLDGTNVKSMPESIKHLPHLKCLNLRNCRKLQSLPQIPPSLHELYLDDCILLEKVFTPTPQLLRQHLAYYQSSTEESDSDDDGAHFSLKNCPKLEKDAIDAITKYSKRCNNGRKIRKNFHL